MNLRGSFVKENVSQSLSLRTLKKLTAVVFILVLTLGVVLFSSWVQKPRETSYTLSTFSMGSIVQQTVYGEQAEAAASAASFAVTSLENKISWRVENSDIHKLNAAAGVDEVQLSDPTEALFLTLLDVCKQSHGAFDITIAPLSLLWNFDEAPSLPSPEDIAYFRQFVGYENVFCNPETGNARLDIPFCAVDLGAAGKGAACDAVVSVYKEHGVSGAVVAVGGSIGLYGAKADGSDWNIEIRDPNSSGALGLLRLAGGFVSTSGSYEKFFEENGVIYHHILDPKTGYPAESDLVSVTVVADSGALSDALSTACFVLGYEESLPLLEHYGAEAVFVDKTGAVRATDGLQDRFELRASGYTLVYDE